VTTVVVRGSRPSDAWLASGVVGAALIRDRVERSDPYLIVL